MRHPDGFTLLEVVIAGSLLIVLAFFGYRIYERVLKLAITEEISVANAGAFADFEMQLKRDIAKSINSSISPEQSSVVLTQSSGQVIEYRSACMTRTASSHDAKIDSIIDQLSSVCLPAIPCQKSTDSLPQYPVIKRIVLAPAASERDFPSATLLNISAQQPESYVGASICFGELAFAGSSATELSLSFGLLVGKDRRIKVVQAGRIFMSDMSGMTGRVQFD
jgi:hypothetical protein